MRKRISVVLIREQLDQSLRKEKTEWMTPPKEGWVWMIRKCLGMSAVQLAKRLGISKQAVSNIERSDREGHLNLSTLRKVADELGCDVKVTLVPRKPLEILIKERARTVAEQIVVRSDLHMKLEDQGTNYKFQKKEIKIIANELVHSMDRRLWNAV